MYVTYHKNADAIPKIGLTPVEIFDLSETFIYAYQLYDQKCAISTNESYTYLHLSNGDRIDIAH